MWIILSYIRRNNVLCTDMAQRKHKKCTFYVKNKKICLNQGGSEMGRPAMSGEEANFCN